MSVSCHMFRESIYPLGEQSYLYLGGTSILLTQPELIYDLGLLCLVQLNPLLKAILANFSHTVNKKL